MEKHGQLTIELAIVKLFANKWQKHVKEQDALDAIDDFYR